MSRFIGWFALLVCCGSVASAVPSALMYMTEGPESVRSFVAHADKIDVIVPTWYQVDAKGLVTGSPNPLVLETARQHHVPVMPILALFGKKEFHDLAGDVAAQDTMNGAMVREAKLHGYSGFQFDFENLEWTDRDGLTATVKRSAEALHKAGFQLTIATVPNAPGYPGGQGFAKWIYTDWRGAYDLAELAKSVDLICLMTYDQQTRWTTPGPVAGWQWTVENMEYALAVVPKQKLSLGIPFYGYHWYTGAPRVDKATGVESSNVTADYISAEDAELLAKTYKANVEWDATDRGAFFFFYRDQMREWVFFTDSHTFRERYDLMRDHGLQGFCSWVLGTEDPAIWDALPSHP
ncbi:MAG TPA: glycosyl hydrolase family 18 protein [Terracidiphilus sp.]|jgi:spore germination protein YaaH|nr:glycosyl hydrolase family 18 protein [Terracidiphilus sp.]